jgi:membrane glycosyltransferase
MDQEGVLVLASSDYEYAVYDHDRTYGSWPKTRQGHRLAMEAFGAYGQSRAHGVAYAAGGYQDPARLGMPTAPVVKSKTYAAPLSFVGSTRRIVAWSRGAIERNPHMRAPLWIMTVSALLVSWAVVFCWYAVVFGLFGILMIPYRLVRRSQRKSLHVQETALATQQAMYQQMTAIMQQQAAMQAREQYPPGPQVSGGTPSGGPSLPPG